MQPLTKEQQAAFERGKWLLECYKMISPEHKDLTLNLSVIAGDMIADIQYAMSSVYDFREADVESVRIAALNSLRHP